MRARHLSRDSTLTAWEDVSLQKTFNLADGHAHQQLSPEQLTSLGELTQTLKYIEREPQRQRELEFVYALNGLSGQTLRPESTFLHYSCSVSIDSVAKLIRARGITRVALATPTFDNIPLLLRRHGCELLAADVRIWSDRAYRAKIFAACDAIFLVCPNNPTGTLPQAEDFEALLMEAVAGECLVIVDFSFRLYTSWHVFDQYAIARRAKGLRYIYLEDSGKFYPTGELKLGVASASEELIDDLEEITDELLLNVSPVILNVVSSLMRSDLQHAGLAANRILPAAAAVSQNRQLLRTVIDDFPIVVEFPRSTISVEWLRLPSPTSTALSERMGDLGVAILPGRPFLWTDPNGGEYFVRIALARDPAYFADAMAAFRHHLTKLIANGFLS